MIEFSRSYKTSAGQAFFTLDAAKKAELQAILAGSEGSTSKVAERILEKADQIVDVLTTTIKPEQKQEEYVDLIP